MVVALRDNRQWDEWAGPMRCAFKLVKLAAGTFQAAHVFDELSAQQSQPSWVAVPVSTSTKSSSTSDGHRTSWRRPWREGTSCRLVRWEKAGLRSTRHELTSLLQQKAPAPSPKRQILVDIPCPAPIYNFSGYTTKYFGVIGGALAVMTKVDQMKIRQAMPTLFNTSVTRLHSDDDGCTENNRRKCHHRRRNRSTVQDLKDEGNTGPWDRVPTAMDPPEIEPVEGPLPPPWSGSKVLAIGDDAKDGGVDDNDNKIEFYFPESSAGSHEAWGSAMMVLSDVDAEGDECRRPSASALDILQDAAERCGDGDEVSSSLSSIALENGSWATLPGGSIEEYPSRTTTVNITPGVPVQTRGDRDYACVSVATEAALAGGVNEPRKWDEASLDLADPVVAVPEVRPQKSTICIGVCDEPQQLGFGLDLAKPQPELYDIWIPQQHFRGKALTQSFRQITKKTAVVTVSSRTRREVRGGPTPDVATSPAKKRPIRSCAPAPPTLESNPQWALPGGTNCLADGKLVLKLPHTNTQHEPKDKLVPPLYPNEALVEHGQWVESEGCESDDSGGIMGESREEYFDYAKRFSWRAAAQVGTPAESEEADKFKVTISQEERATAAGRARVRCEHAAQSAVGRLRGPQSVFHPLHRTPTRPEMRRSVTHGHFSPTGRKLWRRSDGIPHPRIGQVCLRAAPPVSRIPASHAENFAPAAGNSTVAGWSGESLTGGLDGSWRSDGTLKDDNHTGGLYRGDESGARLAPASCMEPSSPREQKQMRQWWGDGLRSDRSSEMGGDAARNTSYLLTDKSRLFSDDQRRGVTIPIMGVGQSPATTMDPTSAIGVTRSWTTYALDEKAHREQDEHTKHKHGARVDGGRQSGDSIVPVDRFTTDSRRKGMIEKPLGRVGSGKAMNTRKHGESTVVSAVEGPGTFCVQRLAPSSPRRCRQYHVTIPYSCGAREVESAGYD